MNKYFAIIFILTMLTDSAWTQRVQFKGSDFFDDKSKIDNPFGLRDPFKNLNKREMQKEGAANDDSLSLSEDGSYSNVPQLPKEITLDKITVVGVLIGKNRRALVKIGDKNVTLKEGMKVGKDELELKAILPGGLVFVEKIKNIYGHEEYLETIIPLSK